MKAAYKANREKGIKIVDVPIPNISKKVKPFFHLHYIPRANLRAMFIWAIF